MSTEQYFARRASSPAASCRVSV